MTDIYSFVCVCVCVCVCLYCVIRVHKILLFTFCSLCCFFLTNLSFPNSITFIDNHVEFLAVTYHWKVKCYYSLVSCNTYSPNFHLQGSIATSLYWSPT
jgi:hypothetical protein